MLSSRGRLCKLTWIWVLVISPNVAIWPWTNQPLGASVSYLKNGIIRAVYGVGIRNKWVSTVLAELQHYLLIVQLISVLCFDIRSSGKIFLPSSNGEDLNSPLDYLMSQSFSSFSSSRIEVSGLLYFSVALKNFFYSSFCSHAIWLFSSCRVFLLEFSISSRASPKQLR